MTSDDHYNPYESPKSLGHPTPKVDGVQLPAVFTIDRSPLIDIEKRCFQFSVESSAITQCNEAKLAVLHHVQTVVGCPFAIFANLQRVNYENAFCYSGKGLGGFPLDHVIMVYVEYDEVLNELVVFDWEPKVESRVDHGLPITWQTDLRDSLIWRR